MAQHALERVIEPAADVIIGRGDDFVIEAEALDEGAQHRVVVVRETLMGAERHGAARPRLAETRAEHLLVEAAVDRMSVVEGKGGYSRVDLVGSRVIQKK